MARSDRHTNHFLARFLTSFKRFLFTFKTNFKYRKYLCTHKNQIHNLRNSLIQNVHFATYVQSEIISQYVIFFYYGNSLIIFE